MRYLFYVLLWISGLGGEMFFPLPSCQASPLKIDITQGQIRAIPVALCGFSGADSELRDMVLEIMTYDLETTGLFSVVPQGRVHPLAARFSQDPASSSDFEAWRQVGASVLLKGEANVEGSQITFTFRLFDVVTEKEQWAKTITVQSGQERRAAHMIADTLYSTLMGEEGYFNTKIACIHETGKKGPRRKRRLLIMDYDGEGLRYLTSGQSIVLTPRYAPDNRKIAYLSYEGGTPQIFIYDLDQGTSRLLHQFTGYNMSFAPRFSSDSTELVMSLSKEGHSAIYKMTLADKQLVRLTQKEDEPERKGHGIDTSPCFSPDNQKIVFTSDREGSENLYVMTRGGEGVHRISFGGGTYSQPVWSPRGNLIAFTKKKNGIFYIGVMEPGGENERLIASGYLVEAPVWSANGRVLIYTKENRKGETSLYGIDLKGQNEFQIPTPGQASDGAWSQLLGRIS